MNFFFNLWRDCLRQLSLIGICTKYMKLQLLNMIKQELIWNMKPIVSQLQNANLGLSPQGEQDSERYRSSYSYSQQSYNVTEKEGTAKRYEFCKMQKDKKKHVFCFLGKGEEQQLCELNNWNQRSLSAASAFIGP